MRPWPASLAPAIQRVAIGGGVCELSFVGYTTTLYTLQARTSLTTGTWSNVSGAGPTRGVGGSMTLKDTNIPLPMIRFYVLEMIVTP